MPSDVRDSIERGWREIRMAAVDRDGTFLDVGCADGFLMESVRAWGAEEGYAIEPYGVDISQELAALARHLLEDAVAPGGRLIVGVFNEENDDRRTERRLASRGYEIAGRVDAEHRDPRVAYRAFRIEE